MKHLESQLHQHIRYLAKQRSAFPTRPISPAALSATGKLYVGKADGEDGIWGRWLSYAATVHGGNVGLKQVWY